MGCAHVTVVPACARAELHGKHETTVTSITRSLDDVLLIRFDGDVQIGHVGCLREPVSGEVSALPTLFVG